MAIFSRSAHLKSLGVELTDPVSTADHTTVSIESQSSSIKNVEESSILRADRSSQVDNKKTSSSNGTNNAQDWAKFKSEFSESLQASEETMTLSGDGDFPLNDFKQQLLLSAILAMHDDTEARGLEVDTASVETPKSPSKLRRRLVSLNSLETIHESELDKLLECDNLLPGDQPTDAVEDNLTSPFAPRLVWEKEDTGQLLRELEKVSKASTTHSVPTVSTHTNNDWRNPSTGKHCVCFLMLYTASF